jgi:hypothetical protein
MESQDWALCSPAALFDFCFFLRRTQKLPQMTPIVAKVLAVDRQGDKYLVIIQIMLRKFRGSFNTLTFGEKKPFIGSCHNGRLDLVYCVDPGLKTGGPFPLWRID